MLASQFLDKEKNKPEQMAGFEFDGIPVKRQRNMIYWYRWGKHTFDIRILRKVLSLPEEHPADRWFMDKCPDEKKSFNILMTQIKEAVGNRTFNDLMKQHDKELKSLTSFIL